MGHFGERRTALRMEITRAREAEFLLASDGWSGSFIGERTIKLILITHTSGVECLRDAQEHLTKKLFLRPCTFKFHLHQSSEMQL